MLHHAKSDSEVTSLAASSPPRSPRRPVYYVMSPSHHDPAEKMSLVSSPPGSPPYQSHHHRYASSPLHQSHHHHSRESSATRFSAQLVVKPSLQGNNYLGAWRKLHQGTGLPGRGGGEDGGEGDEDDEGFVPSGVDPRCYVVWFCLGFIVLFTVFSLVLWASSQAYPPGVLVKSIVFEDLDLQAGMDTTGVPTKMVTLNSTIHIAFRNPATFFGVHVSLTPLELYYYQLKLASGNVHHFYQPRKSTRKLQARVGGLRVPLYGGGPGITSRADGGASANFPLDLYFSVRARAYVLGRLVKPTFHTAVRCSLMFREAGVGKPIDLVGKCRYRDR